MSILEILAIHPAPWRYVLHSQLGQPGGIIRVIDANGQEVALFTVLDYVVQSTACAQTEAAKAASA